MSDDELVEQIQLGDGDAAGELIRRYYPSILRYCQWHCPSREQAEDLTQETFLKLFRGLPRYDNRQKFRAYLYTIANRLCIDESRRRKVYSLEGQEEVAGGRNEISEIEDREEVRQLLSLLSPEQKEAVILRFGEQLSFAEIAKITGCKLRTVQSRVRNALQVMREGQNP